MSHWTVAAMTAVMEEAVLFMRKMEINESLELVSRPRCPHLSAGWSSIPFDLSTSAKLQNAQ